MSNSLKKTTFYLSGLSCAACVNRVEKAIHPLPGIKSFSVNLLKETLLVTFDETQIDEESIMKEVDRAGYRAYLKEEKQNISETSLPTPTALNNNEPELLFRRFIVSLILSLGVFLLSFLPRLNLAKSLSISSTALFFIALAITTIIIAINYRFFIQGFKALIHLSPSMDTLVSTGVLATLVSGILSFAQKEITMPYCFESAAMILTLFTFGRWIENRAKKQSLTAISRLMQLKPRLSCKVNGEQTEMIATDAIKVGDILLIKEGDAIGADGIIISGHGTIDESMMTGETRPLDKTIDDVVLGATINQAGTFKMMATRVGSNSTLSSIIRLMDDVTSSKTQIERLADKISRIFVPSIFLISIITFLVWYYLSSSWDFAITQAINVLVISCPCALALATPVAIMVGTGQSTLLGILIKSVKSIESIGQIDTIALDKTGTLTQGNLKLTTISTTSFSNEKELLTVAASLEYASSHPISKAILSHPKVSPLLKEKIDAFQNVLGVGLTGVMRGEEVFIGNLKILNETDKKLHSSFLENAYYLAAQGQSIFYVKKNNTLLGFLALSDTVKVDAKETIEKLKQLKMHIVMLSGDIKENCAAIAKQLDINEYKSQLLPQDKQRYIQALQNKGKHVMMVGDGINDAPALAQADIGVAMGAGTDIAMATADMVLMRSSLYALYQAITFSKSILRIIKQNLFWAFFYNLLAIPIAAGVFYPYISLTPTIGALAMSLSSITIFLNTFRLKYQFQPKSLSDKGVSMQKTIMIDGLNCMHCVACVEKALNAIDGASNIKVNLGEKKATLTVTQAITDTQLTSAIENAGFSVKNIS